jgi:hypothetical protein
MMRFRVRLQTAEALGDDNRWFCSKAYGRKITDPEVLWAYFISNGGAQDFASRFKEAMGTKNRWYCSEFYGRDIRDPQILWEYFIKQQKNRFDLAHSPGELCLT